MKRKGCIAAILSVVAIGCADGDSYGLPGRTATPTQTAGATRTPTVPSAATATSTPTRQPTVTATAASTPLAGPVITFSGMTRADDTLLTPNEISDDGTPIYVRRAGATGLASGFVLVIEGRPGASGAPVGTSTYDMTGSSFPDLHLQATRPLGNGSIAICDDPQAAPGGVPAVFPVSFDPTPENIAAANDFACRFLDGRGGHNARTSSGDSCVSFNGTFDFAVHETRTQFCGFVNVPLGLHGGDTLITARLRDAAGNWSAPAQLIVRVSP